MKRQTLLIIGVIFLLGAGCMSQGEEKQPVSSEPFEDAIVYFEQNATDGDAEVVFKAKGGDEGLLKLKIVAPDGRTVIDCVAPERTKFGIRQFHLESPEPEDVEGLKKAYPEGMYQFTGTDTDGTEFKSRSMLSHHLPAITSVLQPDDEAENISATDLEITWTPVKNVAAYILEVEPEEDELEGQITAKLPGSAAAFAVPNNFLLPNTEYKIAIGTVSKTGNISFIETTFTTGGED